jgi:hypothetical protein
LWSHNDSGAPVLFALDDQGRVTKEVRVIGARVDDWEALAVGACGTESCLYIGDIGDNDGAREQITVYRVPEPDAASATAEVADAVHAAYPDGPQDAEALLASGDGRLYVVTKGEKGPIAIYRVPTPWQPGSTVRLEPMGTPMPSEDRALRVTDGAVSPDGQWAVLRSRSRLTFYRAADLLTGSWRTAMNVDLSPLKEAQGEGVALDASGMVYVVSEGGGRKQPGTFVRFSCAPPR